MKKKPKGVKSGRRTYDLWVISDADGDSARGKEGLAWVVMGRCLDDAHKRFDKRCDLSHNVIASTHLIKQ